MSKKVAFVYGKGGKTVMMAPRYAETLRKLGLGTYPADAGYQTRMLTAGAPMKSQEDEPKASAAIMEFAADNGVDIDQIVGTGKDGRIRKSDVEAFIDARDLT